MLQRSVEVCSSDNAVELLEQRKLNGATYGDFQFAIDSSSVDFLQVGILSTYSPVAVTSHSDAAENKLLSESEWEELLYLAHTNKSKAFSVYKAHYLSTNGQIYISDTFQLATYINGYHKKIDAKLNKTCAGSEAITELYVPRTKLGAFMKRAATLLRDERANVIYGTVRLIERDDETFLAWATQPWACIIFNLHVDRDHTSIQAVSNIFRSLYQLAIEFGGKYYLTYNRYAASNQLQACYPQVSRFVELKRKYDPFARFNSDWFNYLKNSRNYF
jgi:FAD/FMN-containing dehydrogenase